MKVSFLTTLDHNVGDDFIREGIIFLLKRRLGEFESIFINKHQPVFPPPRILDFKGGRRLWRLFNNSRTTPYFDKILESDIIIQSGGPVYWLSTTHNSSLAEWSQPFWYERVSKVYSTKPVLNLAAGACFPYEQELGNVLNHEELCKFIKDIHGFCRLTTVRDPLAHDMLNQMGLQNYLIPCSSILARFNQEMSPQKPKYFLMNYMHLAGHYSFGQDDKKGLWSSKVLEVYGIAKKQFPIKWVCHNEQEIQDAKSLGVPGEEIFFSKNYVDYIHMYSQGAGGLLNRVHGAMMLASFGRKGFVVGTDSRLQMAAHIGIPTEFVGNVVNLIPQTIFNTVMKDLDQFESKISTIQDQALKDYDSVLDHALGIGKLS